MNKENECRLNLLASTAVNCFEMMNRLDHASEEYAEFIVALNHYKRHREGAFEELTEEICDSIILGKQLEYLFGSHLDAMMAKKLNKLEKQIHERENK